MDKVNSIFRERKVIAGDRAGGVEHDGYVNNKEEFKQMRTYVSQLKKVLNPSNVNKVMQRHDNKLKSRKKN